MVSRREYKDSGVSGAIGLRCPAELGPRLDLSMESKMYRIPIENHAFGSPWGGGTARNRKN